MLELIAELLQALITVEQERLAVEQAILALLQAPTFQKRFTKITLGTPVQQ